MTTQVLKVDPTAPEADHLQRAAEILRSGGLVAFPTETVYGLGASALNADACHKIFAAKGRPATNPLIVHVGSVDEARKLTIRWPAMADRLAQRFWPGPLTLIVPRAAIVPDIVTAGGPTVAIRVPAHPVARELIRAAGIPIAAPSANRSMQLSATIAEHVLRGLNGRVELVLDGGPTSGGLESTVLDITCDPPRLLRPGLIMAAEITALIGPLSSAEQTHAEQSALARSPGMQSRHYAPRTPLELAADDGAQRVNELTQLGLRVGWLRLNSNQSELAGDVTVICMPSDADAYASILYSVLHDLDLTGLDRIVAAAPPSGENWHAIRDRLTRASTPE